MPENRNLLIGQGAPRSVFVVAQSTIFLFLFFLNMTVCFVYRSEEVLREMVGSMRGEMYCVKRF